MKLKLAKLIKLIHLMHWPSLAKFAFVIILASCVPTGPGGNDLEIETAETKDPELVSAPATNLQWGDESVESSVSYASKAKAMWTPSSDAPFFARQRVRFYSDTNCANAMGGWRNVPAGQNYYWVEGLSHLGTVSYRIQTYTSINDMVSPCADSISVDLTTQKSPIITSSCTTNLTQNQKLTCQVTATDLNLQNLTYSISANDCGASTLSINATSGLLEWQTDDDDFSSGSCNATIQVTDTDTDTDTQNLSFTLTNVAPTLSISAQSLLENSGAQVLLTDGEVQASDEGFGVYSISSNTCDPALGSLGAINTSTGELSFTPTANLHGQCEIVIQFNDQNNANNLVTTTVPVTLVSTNQAPTLSDNCATSKNEGENYSCQITSTDGDASDVLTYSLSTANTCTWVDVNGTTGAVNTVGSVALTDLMVGTCTLGLQVSDGNDVVKVQKSVTINNSTPTLSLSNVVSLSNTQPYSVTPIKLDAQVQANEEPGGTYTLVAPDNEPYCSSGSIAVSLTINSTTGAIDFRPQETILASEGTSCFIKVNYADNNGASVASQFLLNWNLNNSPSTIIEPTLNVSCQSTVDQDGDYSCELRIDAETNLDDDPVNWELDPSHTCSWITTGDFTASEVEATPNNYDKLIIADQPTDDHVGTCNLAIRVWDFNDGGTKNYSNTFSRTVTVNNLAPTFNSITTSFTIPEDSGDTVLFTAAEMQVNEEGFGTYSLEAPDSGINCLDPDPGSAGLESGGLSINSSTGKVDFFLADNYSDDCSFKVSFDDGNGEVISQTISIDITEVPDTPVITASCPTSITEDDGTETNTYSCTITLDDPDFEDTFEWKIIENSENPLCQWLQFEDDSVGTLTGIPEDNHVGTCGLKIYVTDSHGLNSNTLSWNVVVNNAVPTIQPDPLPDEPDSGSFLEDSGNIVVKSDSEIQSLDEGFGIYSLDVASVTTPGCHEFGALEIDPSTGSIRFQPATNWSGNCNIKAVFDDENPSSNTDSAEFNVTITEVQDAPHININHCARSVLQDSPYYCEPKLTDPDVGDTVTLNIVSNTCSDIFEKTGAVGSETIENKTGRPHDNDISTCLLTLEAEDNHGNKSATETLNIAIINQPPSIKLYADGSTNPINLDQIYIYEDANDTNGSTGTTLDDAILLKDAQVQSLDEGYGEYSLASPLRSPSCIDIFGTEDLTIDANTGQVTAIPPLNYTGECFLRIRFNDFNSPNGLSTRDFPVKVLPVSDPATLTNDCPTEITQDFAYSCDFEFADIETFEIHTFELAADNTCDWLTIQAVTGIVSGTPRNQNYNGGSCLLSVNVRDGRYSPAVNETVTINITNKDPIFTSSLTDTTIPEDSDLTVIKKHQQVSTDEEGEGGSYSIIASVTSPDCQANSETLTIDSANGEISMKPTADFNGDCHINVQFHDGNTTAITDEFKVHVTALADDLTVVSNCPDNATENTAYTCTALENDPDSPSDITWNLVSGHTCTWISIDASSGVMSGTPNDNSVGQCTLSYQATDGIRSSDIKREVITIANVAPTFAAVGAINVNENDVNKVIDVVAVEGNHEGYGQYRIKATSPSCEDESSISIDPNNGDIYITPSASVTPGNCDLTIEFDDFNPPNNLGEQTITITIVADNDPPELSTVSASPCGSSATEGAVYSCNLNLLDEELTDPQIGTGSDTHEVVLEGTHNCGTISFDTPVLSGTNTNEITFSFTPTNVQSNFRFCQVAFRLKEIATTKVSDIFEKTIKVENSRPVFTHPSPLATRTFTEQDGPYVIFSDTNIGVDNEAALETDDEAEEKAAMPGLITEHRGFYSISTVGSNRCGEGVASGSVIIDSETGATTFDPDETSGEFTGTCNIYIEYNDGTSIENTAEIIIPVQVNPTPDPPTFTGNTCGTNAIEKSEYNCRFNFTDPDVGETMTWSIRSNAGDCTFLEIDSVTGVISGTLDDQEKSTLGTSCQLVVSLNDGSSTVDSTPITVALSASAPQFTVIPIETTIAYDTTLTTIFGDLDIQTDEESLRTNGYSIIQAKIKGTSTDCTAGSGFEITSFNSTTGEMQVSTNSSDLTCQIQIRFTDNNALSVTRTIDVRNRDVDEFMVVDTACPAGPIAVDQYAAFTGCDRSTITLNPVPTPAYDYTTDFRIDETQTTCPLISRDGHGIETDIAAAEISGDFKNLVGTSCDLVYLVELPDGRISPRKKVTYTINNLAPTFSGDTAVQAINEDDTSVIVLTDASIQYNEEENFGGFIHRYSIEDSATDDCQDNGTISINSETGAVTFTPDLNFNGNCNVKIRFNDGISETIDLDRAISVAAVNDEPDIPGATNDNQSCRNTILEGNPYTCTIPHQDPDTGDDIDWSTTPVTHTCTWLSIDQDTGVVSGTPDNSHVGTCVASFDVTDNVGAGVDDTTTYTITIANTSPEISITVVNSIDEDAGDQIVIPDANISVDGEGTAGTYALNDNRAQFPRCGENGTLSINNTNGQISFNPAKDFDGDCFGFVEFDDGNSAEPSSAEFFVTVNGINDAPSISTSCERNISQGDRFICFIRGLNPEEEEELSYTLVNDCGWLKLHYSGVLYGVPQQDHVGTCEAEIKVSDQTFETTDNIYISVENVTPTFDMVAKDIIYSAGTMTVTNDNEVQANEEGQTGTSYSFNHSIASTPKCFDVADNMTIDSDTGAVQFEIEEYKQVTRCYLGITFSDGVESVNAQMQVNFTEDLDRVPLVTSSCPPSITENEQYTCFPSSESPILTGIDWNFHPSHTCDWLSINPESGFIQGVPENADVGECILAFYSSYNGINSALVQYDVTVKNSSPTFVLPNNGNRTIRTQSSGLGLYSDTDIQAPGEGSGFYFLTPSPVDGDCRLHGEVVLDNTSGAVVIAPHRYFSDECTIDIGFFDLNADSGTYSNQATVTVSGANTQPAINATCPDTAAIGAAYACTIGATDFDGDTLTFIESPFNTCDWMVLDSNTGEVSGTPDASHVGTCRLGVYAKDSVIRSPYYQVDITIPNIAGSFTGNFTQTIDEDATFDLVFENADIQHSKEGQTNSKGEIGKYFWEPSNPTDSSDDCRSQGKYLLNKDTGEIRFSPKANSTETCYFKIGFDDLEATDNIQYQTLVVNLNPIDDPPVITSTCANTIEQDSTYQCVQSYEDIDSSVTVVWAKSEHDTCDWLDLAPTGTLTGTPDNNDVGSCFLSLSVTLDGLESLPYEEVIVVTDIVSSFTLDDRSTVEDSPRLLIYSDNDANAQEEGKGIYYLSDEVTSGDKCSDYGTIEVDAATGVTHFTPKEDKNGECYIRLGFQENNSPGSRFETEGRVTITPSNDAPELSYFCNALINQGALYSCTPDFFDPDGDSATAFQFMDNSCSWLSIDSDTGEISGIPGSNDINACTVTIRSSDGNIDTNQVSINIDVINKPPTLTIRDTQINKNSGYSVLRSDQDVHASEEGQGVYALVVTNTQPSCSSKGTIAIDQNTGQITFGPNLNFVGICFVNVSFNDGDGGYVTAEFQVTVNDLDERPTISESCSRNATEQSSYTCTVTKDDDNYDENTANDGWYLADSTINTCTFLSINSSGILSGVPDNQHVGTCKAAFYFSDGTYTSNVKSFDLNVSNFAPTLSLADVPLIEGSASTTAPLPNPNPNWIIKTDSQVEAVGEAKSYGGQPAPPIGRYSFFNTTLTPSCSDHAESYNINIRNGEIRFEPEADFHGDCYFNIQFDDEKGASIRSQFKVTVTNTDDAPIISSNCSDYTVVQGGIRNCYVNVTDVDGEGINSINASGCDWVTIDNDTGLVNINPSNANVGTCNLSIQALDASSTPSNILGPFVITTTNQKPYLTVSNGIGAESADPIIILTDLQVDASDEGDLDTDPGGGGYSIHPAGFGLDCDDIGSLSINGANGQTTLTTDSDYWSGRCYFNLRFDDGTGTADSSNETIVQVDITNVNNAPSINYASCDTSPDENDAYLCVPDSIVDHDLEAGNDTLYINTGPTHSCNWMIVGQETGVLSGTPEDNHVGDCIVHIIAQDSEGASDEYTFTVTVENQQPVLNIANAVIDENTSTLKVIRADSDVQASDEGFGTYSVQSASVNDCNSPSGAVTVDEDNGAVSFNPPAPITANCNINIRFTDTNSEFQNAQFTVFVQTVDNPPVLSATCPSSITQEAAYSCSTPPDVTDDNASDIIFMTGSNHTCHWIELDPITGVISGTPSNDNIGDCTLELKAYDGAYFSNTYTKVINVQNNPPTLTIATPLTFDEDNPTIRDPLSDSDVQASEEGNGVYSVSDTTSGSPNCKDIADVEINESNGAITFDSPEHYNGTCYINVVFDDGNTSNNIVEFEVQLIVNPLNDTPTMNLAGCNNNPDQGVEYSCRIATTDPDNENLLFEFDTGHECDWMNISPGSGLITGTPGNSDVETCLLQVKVTDEASATSQSSLSIVVANVAPTLNISNIGIPSGSSLIEVLSDEQVQASEEGDGTYSIDNTAVTGVNCNDNSSGLTIDSNTGAVSMDIDNSFSGNCGIGVKFSDGKGGNITDVVAVTVTSDPSLIPPQLSLNSTLEIHQGDINVILSNHLKLEDRNNSEAQVIFTLDSVPTYGSLKKSGTILNQGETFDLAQLAGGSITYNHGGAYQPTDSFNFTVTDGTNTISGSTFNINVLDSRQADQNHTTLVFATNGETTTDLSSKNKDFSDVGYIGDALTFNSTGDQLSGGYISWPSTESNYRLNVDLSGDGDFASDAFTIHFYFKTTATAESFIMATRNYSFDNLGLTGWGFKTLADGKIQYSSHDAAEEVIYASDIAINDDKWHAVTVNRNGNFLKLFIDGVLQGTRIDVSATDIQAEDTLVIGSGVELDGSLPNGLKALDELRIYRGNSSFTDNHFAFTCPHNFVMVPGSLASGHANPFCVAKYEMKQLDLTTPVSKPEDLPWDSVNQSQAITYCNNMGTGYSLIKNPQWMTIAHNIESVAANWSNGIFTTPAVSTEINRGHGFAGSSALVASADDADFCLNVVNCETATGWDQEKRTHILNNGSIIWDLSGNVAEHVQKTVNSDKPGANTPNDIDFDVNEAVPTNDMPSNAFQPLISTQLTAEDHGIGTYLPGNENVGGIMIRGGAFDYDVSASPGIYFLDLRNATSQQAGFRCIFLTE